jgi:hypothetical protein
VLARYAFTVTDLHPHLTPIPRRTRSRHQGHHLIFLALAIDRVPRSFLVLPLKQRRNPRRDHFTDIAHVAALALRDRPGIVPASIGWWQITHSATGRGGGRCNRRRESSVEEALIEM